ncbi:MAG: hypothetical protein V1826_02680 [bacterium]
MRQYSLQLGLLVVAMAVGLGGCFGFSPSLPASEVIARFSDNLASLKTFHYEADLNLSGNVPTVLGEDLASPRIAFEGDVANQNLTSPQFTLSAQVRANSSAGPVVIAGQMVGLSGATYFRLSDLVLPTLLPVSLGADARWYRIKHPVTDSSQPSDRLGVEETLVLTPDQALVVKEAIAQHSLFEVVEQLPGAIIGGQPSYHYRVRFDQAAAQNLLEQLDHALALKSSEPDFKLISNYEPEIWINRRTFQLTQLKLTDSYLSSGRSIGFEFVLRLSRPNTKITVSAPNTAEEFRGPDLLKELPLLQW